jgi:hypothetical protein
MNTASRRVQGLGYLIAVRGAARLLRTAEKTRR